MGKPSHRMTQGKGFRIRNRLALDVSLSTIVAVWLLDGLALRIFMLLYALRGAPMPERVLGISHGVPPIFWDMWMVCYDTCKGIAPVGRVYDGYGGVGLAGIYALCLACAAIFLLLLRWTEKQKVLFGLMDRALFWTSWVALLGILSLICVAWKIKPYEETDYKQAFEQARREKPGDERLTESYYRYLVWIKEDIPLELQDTIENSFVYIGKEAVIKHWVLWRFLEDRSARWMFRETLRPGTNIKVLMREKHPYGFYLVELPSGATAWVDLVRDLDAVEGLDLANE